MVTNVPIRCRLAGRFQGVNARLLLAAALAFGPATGAIGAPVSIVAVGDSYTAGPGLTPYVQGTDTPDNRCRRSTRAYPFALAASLSTSGIPATAVSLACTGARARNVGFLNADGAHITGEAQFSAAPVQLLTGRVDATTDVVVVSIGGNDAGFTDVLTQCADPARGSCAAGTLPTDLEARIRRLRASLESSFSAVQRLAPNATVVAVGYPHPFAPEDMQRPGCGSLAISVPLPLTGRRERFVLFDGAERALMNRASDWLDETIAAAATATGAVMVDPRADWRGHEVCGSGTPWLAGITGSGARVRVARWGTRKLPGIGLPVPAPARWEIQLVGTGAFHPTVAGMRDGYAASIRRAIEAGLVG